MNFFEHQANARRQTGRLLVYFTLAVLLTIAAVNSGLFALGRLVNAAHGHWYWHDWSAQAVMAVLFVVAGGSLLEYLRLRGGGQAIAEMMGGRRLDFATGDIKERQFINVVAEMAIASGVPSPVLYVMDREYGINAFVAGLNMDETVMVVTAGALETFSRDEMQAVVGHEFSHILNGDMRLNIRLMALLAGILAIGQIGGFLMRVGADFGGSSVSSRRHRGFSPHLIAIGLMLWLVGALGLFFGRLIKAAVSRQREFLADASSVQFTRNPDGLASALMKIKHASEGSWLGNIRAESMSHMCFGETLDFSSLFATHPPLDERIAVLGKHYLVRDRVRQREQRRQKETAATVAAVHDLPLVEKAKDLPPIPYLLDPAAPAATELQQMLAPAAALVARAGTVRPEELDSARELHRRLPAGVQEALQTSRGAQALLYALLARQSAATPEMMRNFLHRQEPDLVERVAEIFRLLEGLDLCYALPLTELALPRLLLLDIPVQREFLARLQAFAHLDRRLSSFEFALLMLLRKQLHVAPKARSVRLQQCMPLIAIVVATFLRTGGMEGEKLELTFRRLMRTVCAQPPALPAPGLTRLSQLAMGMQVLAGLSLQDKKHVLELAATAVLADAEVRLDEYELLRVVAALLDCPMPRLAA